MKYYKLLSIIYVFILPILTTAQNTKMINDGTIIIEKNLRPANLFKSFLISHKINPDNLETIVKDSQRLWLRNHGLERWHLKKTTNEKLFEKFKLFGMTEACYPSDKFYHYLLIFGAAIPTMQKRIDFLKKLYYNGVRFKEIIFLTGQRILDPKVDKIKQNKFTKKLTTEADAVRYIIKNDNFFLHLSKDIQIKIIDTQNRIINKSKRRPTTSDTIREWLNTNPPPNTILAISNQPYIGWQSSILNSYLPSSFQSEVVGGSSSNKLPTDVYLDNLARWLYQLQFYYKKEK